MGDKSECKDRENVTIQDDVKHLDGINFLLLPSGGEPMNDVSSKHGGKDSCVETEHCERKKKTRRGKPKRKNPYNKDGNDARGQASSRPKICPRFAQRQPDAPYNTNQFLMEDHNDVQDLDVQLKAVNPAPASSIFGTSNRPPRARDPSFTSVDSEEDYFYSSPEDEEEFLTKEFSNTYEDLHVEALAAMTKAQLIQQVLQLEEKVDVLEKKLGSKCKTQNNISEVSASDESDDKELEKLKHFQSEIAKLVLENEKLQIENDRLRRRNRSSSVSSVDSESDSSTSSPSSVSDLSVKDDEEPMCSPEDAKSDQDVEVSVVISNGGQDIVMADKETAT